MSQSPAGAPNPRFWDRIAQRYARRPVPDQEVYETKLAKTAAYLQKSDRLLEVGCGTGTTALHHAPQVAHVHATDLSPAMIEIARRKAEEAGVGNVRFGVGALEDLDADPGSYDAVLAHSVLHLVDDVEGALARLRQVLKPGGVLVASVPCVADAAPWFRFIAPLGEFLGLVPHVNLFTSGQLFEWIERGGFTVEESWLPSPKRGHYLVLRAPEVS